MNPALAAIITQASGRAFVPVSERPVGGGCIHAATRVDGRDGRHFFVKRAKASELPLFAAEADGLSALAAAAALRVPLPLAAATLEGDAYLVLEWLDMAPATGACAASLGELLARQHLAGGGRFGWGRDNFIGGTPQRNGWSDDWIAFYGERRLAVQFGLAREAGNARLAAAGERLIAALPAFFAGYTPRPALLHGDLWSGNAACAGGEPVVFDPAVYCGDAEAELAMTELFGGFGREFYAAYRAQRPLDPGYALRRGLYQLYHVLNHAHLFGGGYAAQAERLTGDLLQAVR